MCLTREELIEKWKPILDNLKREDKVVALIIESLPKENLRLTKLKIENV